MQTPDITTKIKDRLDELFYSGQLSNEQLVSVWKHIGGELLALKRVKEYAGQHQITPQGTRKFRPVIKFCGYSLVIDND